MIEKYKVDYNKLKNKCNLSRFHFNTTDDLIPLQGIIGQDRASKALELGLSIKKKGYNVYVSGESGTGRNSYVKLITEKLAKSKGLPDDWVYVYNFNNPDSPIALRLKTGMGKEFVKDMENTIETLKREIENTFTSREYENMKNVIYQKYQIKTDDVINSLNKIAKKYDFVFTQSENGLLSIPLKNGKPISEEDYDKLTIDEYEELKRKTNEMSLEAVDIVNELRDLDESLKENLKELDYEVANRLVTKEVEKLINKFNFNDKIVAYLDNLIDDIVYNIEMFKNNDLEEKTNEIDLLKMRNKINFYDRYKVNLFIDNSRLKYAPIIFESNPTYYNLVGSVEYKNEMGIMQTDFTQIKPGALHKANGGYLVIQAKDLISNTSAWKGLKRALKIEEVNIEGLGSQLTNIITSTLRPESIPIDLKVILIGDLNIYYTLYSYDEDFKKLFKIMADFDIEMERNEDNVLKMARFIATHCDKEDMKHFSKEAIEKIIEYSSRLADSQNKLSSRFNRIVEILYEAEAFAEIDNSDIVDLKHVDKAIDEKIYRNNRYEEKILEMFKNGDYLLDVEGEKIGEINGLAVIGTGEYSFGKPSKITVSTYRGKQGIINIEREAKTSGKIHDKGVMIISGYLGYKYAQKKPLALSASIVFEQLYSGVDGDSASSTELYALLSSITKIPIKQNIAVTGSINQRGEIQPIGGVNEKIEGFYKVCKLKGLTGTQGVIIPYQNVKNLMLNQEVIDAIREGKFHIYSVKTIDEGIEILTGIKAGTIDNEGNYPEGTIHYFVNKALDEFRKENLN